jgi:hypothetical protein
MLLLGSSGAFVIPKMQIHRTVPTDLGFPVKLSTVTHLEIGANGTSRRQTENTFESEVTELSDAPLDPALFEVPGGFKLVEKLNHQLSEVPSKTGK